MEEEKTIQLEQIAGCDFEFHVENGEVIIDRREGISPENGLALFEPWMLGLEK